MKRRGKGIRDEIAKLHEIQQLFFFAFEEKRCNILQREHVE